ncbi:MAG TPA: ABC transporter ATP-binding protein [Burkholderiales bacterium]|jgi:multiple sugar transport system ATP-binding protein|nr:ABC transporter ATP-binding protein [Burkholderiales bacterium]
MADIVLRDVEKYFGDNYIIRKLNLEIRHREFVVLLGPSGCGKTTTLRAIAGLEEIDTGDILIDGKPVQAMQAADRDIAFVFQLFALYPHLTAYENIAFPLRATNESRETVDRRVREAAKSLRIEHLLDKRPGALSGGDLQRVAIGRALVRRPKALLMDEPIGALDAKLREEMRTELKRLHIENEATTVYVTHDQVEAMSMADRIAIMNDGVLQQVGTPTEVYQHPENLFVAQFIGSPIMNVVNGAVRPGGGDTQLILGDNDAQLSFPQKLYPLIVEKKHAEDELAIGVRPEGVLVARQQTPGYVPVEAHIIEPLGPFDIVDLKFGAQMLRARTSSGYVARAGDVVWAKLDEAQTHFFSTRSGESLHIRL